MVFEVDTRISDNSFYIGEGPLSNIFLKNNAAFSWLIIVPRQFDVREIYELTPQNQVLLIQEISSLSKMAKEVFAADKLNIGALGNIVPQLHIHIVARKEQDGAWPHSVWQEQIATTPYEREQCSYYLNLLKAKIRELKFNHLEA